jgi:hypothetical protein
MLVLRSHLEASLFEDDMPQGELASAIIEHRELVARRGGRGEDARQTDARQTDARQTDARHTPPATTRPGDPNRSREFGSHPGWRWTRLVRRYDEYQWGLAQVRARERVPPEAPAENPRRPVRV